MAISDGGVLILRTALLPYQRASGGLVAFEQCVDECLGFLMFERVSMLASQGLSREAYRSFWSLLPPEFLTHPVEDLVAPILGVSVRLPVTGWTSRDFEESVPVQYLTVVN